MKKRYKLLIIAGIFLASPFIVAGFNLLFTLYFNTTYKNLGQPISSANYRLDHIQLSGKVLLQDADTKEIDTMSIQPLNLDSNGNEDILHPAPPVYVKYTGQVYMDTIHFTFRVEIQEEKPEKESEDPYGKRHMVTLDRSGNVLLKDTPVKGAIKPLTNCVLLKDIMLPWQPWLDTSKPFYLRHFSKESFNSHCMDPLRGWGSPNGAGRCYTWTGHAYYNIVINGETLKFKTPSGSTAVLYSDSSDYPTYIFNYAEVPERFRNKVNVSFLVYEDKLYMAWRK